MVALHLQVADELWHLRLLVAVSCIGGAGCYKSMKHPPFFLLKKLLKHEEKDHLSDGFFLPPISDWLLVGHCLGAHGLHLHRGALVAPLDMCHDTKMARFATSHLSSWSSPKQINCWFSWNFWLVNGWFNHLSFFLDLISSSSGVEEHPALAVQPTLKRGHETVFLMSLSLLPPMKETVRSSLYFS